MQRVQNFAARLIMGAKKHEHITPILVNLHWPPIRKRINFKVIILTFKIINGLSPPYFNKLIEIKQQSRSLRSNITSDGRTSHILKHHRLSNCVYGERAFSNTAPLLWNKLPVSIRMIQDINNFKRKLKTYLF